MRYFTWENDALAPHEVDTLPPAIEELYAHVRQAYSIELDLTDWADDDTDAGWGYCYDNSYSVVREPLRSELVVGMDGELYGLCVTDNLVLVPGAKEQVSKGHYHPRYGDSYTWKLLVEETPSPADHVFLPYYPSPDSQHEFTPSEFPSGVVEAVHRKINVENSRGHFDNRARLTLKLTPAAMADPDGTLAAFDCLAVLARVR